MKILKRLLYVLGFMPVALIASISWIWTGKDPLLLLQAFEDWCIPEE